MRSVLLLAASAVVTSTLVACAPAPQPPRAARIFDPALVREQLLRIAGFDSVVRTVNTDSLYRLWQTMLTTSDIRATQLLVQCEYAHLTDRYGLASYYATQRMRDTLWRHADPVLVSKMDRRMEGASPPIRRGTCGPPPANPAPYWLREWSVPKLPKLPPSPDDTTTADP